MPIVAFLVLNRWVSLGWAVVGATGWSIKAVVSRRRHGEVVGRFLPLLVAYLATRGVIGIVTDSEAVYFGIGIGTKALIGFVLIGTVVAGRPFLAKVFPLAVHLGAATVADTTSAVPCACCCKQKLKVPGAWDGVQKSVRNKC